MSNHGKKYYTIYLKSTDEIVASGTASECASQMNKSLNCFHSTVSKTLKGKHNKYVIVIDSDSNTDELE